jgi:hypothetical protein
LLTKNELTQSHIHTWGCIGCITKEAVAILPNRWPVRYCNSLSVNVTVAVFLYPSEFFSLYYKYDDRVISLYLSYLKYDQPNQKGTLILFMYVMIGPSRNVGTP